jgi:hypothetical protein
MIGEKLNIEESLLVVRQVLDQTQVYEELLEEISQLREYETIKYPQIYNDVFLFDYLKEISSRISCDTRMIMIGADLYVCKLGKKEV